jgi:site-specific DNA recombinase
MTSRTSNHAALYLRSSKDRSDVSIDAQRRELTALATQRNLLIVREYSDVVESGTDENRPGLRSLVGDIKKTARGWDTVMLLDTSRLARKPIISVMFERDAEKHGVRVVYKSVPDDDPITAVLLKSLMMGIDQWHSLTSKRKGLAGMAENVRQGFRAGGRAPRGYRLTTVATGAIREGAAVTKTKLEPNDDAALVADYLRFRAEGIARTALIRQLKIKWPGTSLIGLEWNALTYAGHTVWNVHNEFSGDGYKGGNKRRPRSEWVIQRDTHPPLVSDAIAETVLQQIEKSSHRDSRRPAAVYLLTGMLKTPAGGPWYGNSTARAEFYRAQVGTGTRSFPAERIDRAVIETVAKDLLSPAFVAAAVKSTREKFATTHDDDIADARERIAKLDARARRLLEMACELKTPAPALRRVDEVERERAEFEQRIVGWEKEDEAGRALASVTDTQVRAMLGRMAEEMKLYERAALKDFLGAILDRIELDPELQTLQVCYRIPLHQRGGNSGASPRGFEPRYSP